MKILILGSDGFVGRAVSSALTEGHDVYLGAVHEPASPKHVQVDLTKPETIFAAVDRTHPEAIINCAGIVENSDKAKLNAVFTGNILQAALDSGRTFRRIIVTGSAAEYGIVDRLPVSEDASLKPTSLYGESKVEETTLAQKYRKAHHLPVTVARLFNPIGAGMHPRMLIPSLIRQLAEVEQGSLDAIEVSRLDAKRDYINVRDVSTAIQTLVEQDPTYPVYNIGSGRATSNADLIDLLLESSKLKTKPRVIETSDKPEPLFANQADITRIKSLAWSPAHTLAESIEEIIHG